MVGVRIALGDATIERCPSFDSDASGAVEIGELVNAVSHALEGCPATFALEGLTQLVPAIRAMDATSSTVMDSLHFFNGTAGSSRSLIGLNGFVGVGAGECPRGGSDERICEVLDGSLVRIPYRLDACSYGRDGTLITTDGSTALIGFGSCPGLFLPSAARFEMDQFVTIRESGSSDRILSQTRIDIAGIVESVLLNQVFCALGNTVLGFAGSLAAATDANTLEVEFDRAELDGRFGGLPCRPFASYLRIDGQLRTREGDLESVLETTGLTLERRIRMGNEIELGIDGLLELGSTGEAYSVATIEPLRLLDRCPVSGTLELELQGAIATVVFAEDARVALDLDGDGETDVELASCEDAIDADGLRR